MSGTAKYNEFMIIKLKLLKYELNYWQWPKKEKTCRLVIAEIAKVCKDLKGTKTSTFKSEPCLI